MLCEVIPESASDIAISATHFCATSTKDHETSDTCLPMEVTMVTLDSYKEMYVRVISDVYEVTRLR